ncbi:MAG TPA: transposase [Candidatus Nitrosocosmicus sp.]
MDRNKLGTKRHILTDKKGIPVSAVISSASTHDIKQVTDVIDNAVVNRPSSYKNKTRKRGIGGGRKLQHLCLDDHTILNLNYERLSKEYMQYIIPYKRKRNEKDE